MFSGLTYAAGFGGSIECANLVFMWNKTSCYLLSRETFPVNFIEYILIARAYVIY